jgi:hypothetical protein
MTDKQQPPEIPDRIWVASPVEFKSLISKSGPAFDNDIPYARVHIDEGRVGEIRKRRTKVSDYAVAASKQPVFGRTEKTELGNYPVFSAPNSAPVAYVADEGDAEFYANAPADIDYLLSLLPQLSSGGEVGQLNQRIAELEKRLKIPFGKLPCALCGGPHDFDTSVPSVIWNSVIRAKSLPDYLCTTCIVREFVRQGQSFTAELWNEEFNGVPIEVVVNGQNARDAAAIQEENNSLRNQLSSSEQPTGSGKCEHGISWSMECLSCGPSDFKAVATTSPTATAVNRSYADGYTRGFRHGMQSRRSISGSERRCGFCNKSEYEVSALIQAAIGYICNECVQICADIIKRNEPSTPSERRCGKCDHADAIDPHGRCMSVYYDAGGSLAYCGCKCALAATDMGDPITAPPFANDPTWGSFQQSIEDHRKQVDVADAQPSAATPTEAAEVSEISELAVAVTDLKFDLIASLLSNLSSKRNPVSKSER